MVTKGHTMADILCPRNNKAIENARKLYKRCEGKTPAESAPCTMVFRLIEALLPYVE